MNKIIKKRQLSADVFQMEVEAPQIASSRKAGQFIILMVEEQHGERIPLTIADADEQKGSVTIIFQIVGGTTRQLSQLEEGDYITHFLGPLGNAHPYRKMT